MLRVLYTECVQHFYWYAEYRYATVKVPFNSSQTKFKPTPLDGSRGKQLVSQLMQYFHNAIKTFKILTQLK